MQMKKSYGGQALIEGVMMRGNKTIAMAVRGADGTIQCEMEQADSLSDTYTFLKWPLIRGTVNLVESLYMGFKALTYSANASAETEEEKLNPAEMAISVVISMVLGIGLFFVLPVVLANLTKSYVTSSGMQNILEGFIRVGVFVIYVVAISRMKEIKRVFQYHGAEHKVIHAYEHGEEMTVANAQKYQTLHPRCGTSFLFIVMVISIFVFAFVGVENFAWRMLSRVILLPVIAGISYELLKFSGKHSSNQLVAILSWPGLQLQQLTTAEPEDDMVEVALYSLARVREIEEPELVQATPTTAAATPQGEVVVS